MFKDERHHYGKAYGKVHFRLETQLLVIFNIASYLYTQTHRRYGVVSLSKAFYPPLITGSIKEVKKTPDMIEILSSGM